MAAGLPCITTEVGTGSSWVVQDAITGLIVPPRDPPALAQAIRSLLGNPERRNRMSEGAAARARAEFNASLMVDRVLDVYSQLLRQ
jgi:rhamnosyl/mannosyltransferase